MDPIIDEAEAKTLQLENLVAELIDLGASRREIIQLIDKVWQVYFPHKP